MASVDSPSAHDFRRAFAIKMLPQGMDLLTLTRLMDHTNLKILQHYLTQIGEDLQEAHRRTGSMDNVDLYSLQTP
jgi:integrase/recombinase XerD